MQAKQGSSPGLRFASGAQLRWAALLTAVAFLPCLALAAAADQPAKTENEEVPKLKLEDLVLQTGDGLELTLTYYPGTKGKQTIPIVLLHMWKQSRNDYKDLAPALQAMGYAVIVPDLRGHGQSTHLNGARKDENLKAATMPPQQFTLMVGEDMKAVKDFLWERNNEGELNIDKLCVVGAEMGASVALDFALADALEQDRNRVRRSDYQLGRFVKALVLISPEQSFRGLPTRAATAYPAVQRDIAVLILVGKQDSKALEEAKRIHGIFERHHPEPTGDDKADKKTLWFLLVDTNLQGTKLLDPKLGPRIELYAHAKGVKKDDPKITVHDLIADFINRRLVKSEESKAWTWKDLKVPHG